MALALPFILAKLLRWWVSGKIIEQGRVEQVLA